MLARGITFGGFVDPEDERREHDFATVRIAVGDRSRRRPIRMGLDGVYTRSRKPRCRLLLCRRVGKVQAQLFMGVDRDGFDGLDDLEGQRGGGQPEYRAVAAVAIPERRTQWQSEEVAVELDGRFEMCGAASESDRTDQGQFLRPTGRESSGRLLCHGVDAKTSTVLQVKARLCQK